MTKYIISSALMLLAAIPGKAQFAVTPHAGGSVAVVEDGAMVADPTAAAGFRFGGIDVADIKEIKANALTPDEAGSVLTLPDDLKPTLPAAVLDITAAVNENEAEKRNLYSCEYMLNVAGIPYFVTTSATEAIEKSSLILITSQPKKSTFSADVVAGMREFVNNGGVIFAPNIGSTSSDELKALFGVSAVSAHDKKEKRMITWSEESHPELVYIDEPEEQTTAIGSLNASRFTLSTGTALATFDSDPTQISVVKNQIGKGAAYVFGLLWRDVIQRPQLDKDMDTGRGKSQTFEPSADMYPLFIRAAYASVRPVASWKHSVPEGYSAVLVPTHDCDSRTAYDAMYYMADYEQSLGLRGHYFLTVHYFQQPGYLSAFYNSETLPKALRLLEQNHTVGSHSICHFPDFGSYKGAELEEHFPMKEYTRDTYAAYSTRDVNAGLSYGSTWAELVLSKQILEEDLGNKVRSFRSGHLCQNTNMPLAHKMAGYNYSSCYTASSVQSEFPFIQRMSNDWMGEPTGVLQMPLHFSDVFSGDDGIDENNYPDKAEHWTTLFNKLKGNYASSVLLIHPNREWKMLAQKILIDNMDLADCGLYNFEDYGDFWVAREGFDYETYWLEADGKVVIRAKASDIAANPVLSIMVETNGVTPSAITLIDETGKVHAATVRRLSETRHLLIF